MILFAKSHPVHTGKGARSDRLRLKHAVDTRLPCIILLFFYPHSCCFFYPLPPYSHLHLSPLFLKSELLFILNLRPYSHVP